MSESMLGLDSSESSDEAQRKLRSALEGRLKAGARWFHWVAAGSILNSIIHLTRGTWAFLIGLGLTQFVDGVANAGASGAPEAAAVWKGFAFAIDLVIAAMFVVLGLLAEKRNQAAFVAGIALYLADAGLLFYFGDLRGVLFHALVLWWLSRGWRANRDLESFDRGAAQRDGVSPGKTPEPAPSPSE